MPGMRDARFGQFADPNFGASLNQPQAQGVLPAPTQGTSASEMPDDGGSPFHSGLDSQGPGAGAASNPGSIYLADGGAIPDEDGAQDSGDAAPAQSDPFSVVQSALSYGRQKSGLPPKFYGGAPPMSPASPGANPQLSPQSPGAQPQMKPPGFAEGGNVDEDTGVIPDGNTDQEDQGGQDQMTPSGNTQGQGQGGAGAMSYLTGQGAVGPEIAQALEQQVDPQGTMDPNQRKMLAVAHAGSPDKAFAVLQHYRQKFNAYNAFAKAAAQGSGGRPPDLHASAHAATQAYQHLPDGNDVSFQPVPNGMRVSVRGLSQDQGQGQQNFAEGGSVQEQPDVPDPSNEAMIPEQEDAGDDTAGVMPQQSAGGAPADADKTDKDHMANGNTAPHKAIRDFVLSIPQYLGWLSKDGQADSVFDKGVDSTLEQASKSPMSPMAGGPSQPQLSGQQQPQPEAGGGAEGADQGVTSQQPTDARNQNPLAPQGQSQHKPSPPNPEKFGAEVAAKASSDGLSLKDAMHQIDIAYGNWMGQQKAKALAKAALIQHYADNKAKVEAEQTRSTRAENVARITGTSRQGVAETNAGARRDVVQAQQTGAGERNQNTNQARRDVAHEREGGVEKRFQQGEQGRNDRSIMQNKPGVIGNEKKMNEARQSLGPQQRPAQPQQGAAQTKLVNGKWYKRGPNGEAIEVPGPAQ